MVRKSACEIPENSFAEEVNTMNAGMQVGAHVHTHTYPGFYVSITTDWMFVFSQYSFVEILIPHVMAVGGEAFGTE